MSGPATVAGMPCPPNGDRCLKSPGKFVLRPGQAVLAKWHDKWYEATFRSSDGTLHLVAHPRFGSWQVRDIEVALRLDEAQCCDAANLDVIGKLSIDVARLLSQVEHEHAHASDFRAENIHLAEDVRRLQSLQEEVGPCEFQPPLQVRGTSIECVLDHRHPTPNQTKGAQLPTCRTHGTDVVLKKIGMEERTGR